MVPIPKVPTPPPVQYIIWCQKDYLMLVNMKIDGFAFKVTIFCKLLSHFLKRPHWFDMIFQFNFASVMSHQSYCFHCHRVSLTFDYLRLTSNASLLYILMVIFYSASLCYSIIKYCAVFTLLHALATRNDLLSIFLNCFFFLTCTENTTLVTVFQFWILDSSPPPQFLLPPPRLLIFLSYRF